MSVVEVADFMAEYGAAASLALILAAGLVGYGVARWVSTDTWTQGPARQFSTRARILLILWAALGLVVFLLIVYALRDPGGPLEALDTHIAQGLAATLQPSLLHGVAVFTQLGDRAFLMGVGASVLAILLWNRRWVLAGAWIAASAGGGLLNKLLKALFERVRPEHAHGFLQADGFSFPSGHATGAVAVYGMLAYVLARTVTTQRHAFLFAVACALITAIGMSRVLLHVHYLSDVLAGWAITSAWIDLCMLTVETLQKRLPD